MKFKNKFFLRILLATVVITAFSCKKFLDRKPLGQAISGDIIEGGEETQVLGLYASLQNWGVTSLPWLTFHASRADDDHVATPSDGGDDLHSIVDHYGYTKDFWLMNSVWEDHLAFITQAGNIIADIDSIKATDAPTIVNKAEASFLRAYAYFDMVRDFGEVPIINFKVNQASDANVKKSSVTEVYALIQGDLNFAIQNLPPVWDAKYIGRVNKGAAQTLLAKTYLYQQDWTSCLSLCDAIIATGQYSLDGSYSHLFSEAGENGPESIFEIQNYESANGSVFYSNALTQYQGHRGSGDWDLGWGWNLPDSSLLTAYEPGDPRKDETILYQGQSDGGAATGGYGAILPAYQPGNSVDNWPWWDKKAYTDPLRRAATGDRFGNWLNTIIIRYADVLLMDAEAANELGKTTQALQYLEVVRARARNGTTALPEVTTTDQAQLRIAIKKERRVEFAMEFERFYDLVRWTPASDNIDAIHVLGPYGYTAKNQYLPIPQPDIDKSNGVLIQNPNY